MTYLYDISLYKTIELEEGFQALGVAHFCAEKFSHHDITVFGAGGGTYMRAFQICGFQKVTGYELSDSGIEFARSRGTEVIKRDLSILSDKLEKCSIGVCLEVAEHMTDSELEGLFSHLHCCDFLIFSAAVPGQGGVNHINCKPKHEWKHLVEEVGFHYKLDLTDYLLYCLGKVPCCGWIISNIMVFEK